MSNNSIENFFDGIKEAFNDITALEVNTMIVSEIRGLKFNPEEAYALLYNVPNYFPDDLSSQATDEDRRKSSEYFAIRRITDPSVIERLIKLRKRLEVTYKTYYLTQSEVMKDSQGNLMRMPEILPKPLDFNLEIDPSKINQKTDEEKTLENLLNDSSFLRKLRKLHELRALLENPMASQDNIYDVIYAQTVIQLDGDVINRFDKKLFVPEHKEMKDFLLKIHQDAVVSGEKNWRSLLDSAVNLVKSIWDNFGPNSKTEGVNLKL